MKKLFLSLTLILGFLVYIFLAAPAPQAPAVSDNKRQPSDLPPENQPPEQNSSANSNSSRNSVVQKPLQKYKDGAYIGDVADAYYGNVQVKAVIQGGQIISVQFLQYPSDRRTSIQINSEAMPILKTEAIQAQSAKVDIVSGATQTSGAFQESLGSALAQAKN